jgi:predicted phosphodiesterase
MIKKICVIPDVHLDTKIPEVYKIVRKFVKDFQPDETILLGDFMDVSALSGWDMDKKLNMEGRRFKLECNCANKELDYLQKHSRKVTYIEGNHPYHKNTDLLTVDGWKNIQKITMDDKLAQFNQDDFEITYSKPLGLQKVYTDKVICFENNFTKQVVNPEHNVFYDGSKVKAKNLVLEDIDKNLFPYHGTHESVICPALNYQELDFITWIVMEGCLVFRNSKPHHIQFKLSKKRKINILKSLLDWLDIKYTIHPSKKSGVNILQPYIIRIYKASKKYFNLLNNIKEFPDFFRHLNKTQLDSVLKTISITDGYKTYNKITWVSTNKNNINVIMHACINNGKVFSYTENQNRTGFSNGKTQFRAKFYLDESLFNSKAKTKIKKSIIDYNDYCYCATMPEGTLISRIDGKVAFSGNCHRVIRYLEKNPEMVGFIEIPKVLHLKDRGIEWIDVDHIYKVGHLNFIHGWYANKYHAAKHLDTMGDCVVYGHTHLPQSFAKNMALHKEIMSYGLGCLCDKAPDYMHGRFANWINNFAIIYVDTITNNFNLYEINIIDNQFMWNGKRYK